MIKERRKLTEEREIECRLSVSKHRTFTSKIKTPHIKVNVSNQNIGRNFSQTKNLNGNIFVNLNLKQTSMLPMGCFIKYHYEVHERANWKIRSFIFDIDNFMKTN